MPILPLFAGAILGAGAVFLLKDKRVNEKLREGKELAQKSAIKGIDKLKDKLEKSTEESKEK